MFQLTTDLLSLTQAQREAVACFILSFPQSGSSANDDIVTIPAFTIQDERDGTSAAFGVCSTCGSDREGASCSKCDASPDAGNLEAAAIFGTPIPAAVASGPVLVATPPPPPPPSDDRLDKSGLPWDERIHASSRARTADGNWRKKRGAEDATVTQVEAELKALMGIPAPPVPVAVAPSPLAAVIPTPPSSPAIPPPPALANDRQSYVNLIAKASAAIGAKTLTTDQLATAVIAAGVPSLPLLANRLDLVPQVMTAIEAIIG